MIEYDPETGILTIRFEEMMDLLGMIHPEDEDKTYLDIQFGKAVHLLLFLKSFPDIDLKQVKKVEFEVEGKLV